MAAGWQVWELWSAEPWVVQVLCDRYRVPFVSRPPLSPVLLPLLNCTPSSIRGLALAAAAEDLQQKDAIELASFDPGYYSCLFVTLKVTGSWQPVIDISRLNRFVWVSSFLWRPLSQVSSLFVQGTGWCPSTFRMPTWRFLSIQTLTGSFSFVWAITLFRSNKYIT